MPILILYITGSILSYDSKIEFFSKEYPQDIVKNKEVLSVEELLIKFGKQKPNLNLVVIVITGVKEFSAKIKADTKGIKWSSWHLNLVHLLSTVFSFLITGFMMTYRRLNKPKRKL